MCVAFMHIFDTDYYVQELLPKELGGTHARLMAPPEAWCVTVRLLTQAPTIRCIKVCFSTRVPVQRPRVVV